MGKVQQLWQRFSLIEAELEKLNEDTSAYENKSNELLDTYNEIQSAEENLVTWQTQEKTYF